MRDQESYETPEARKRRIAYLRAKKSVLDPQDSLNLEINMQSQEVQIVRIPLTEVLQFYKRRYLLRPVGIEVFDIRGESVLVCFENEADRDSVYQQLLKKELPNCIFNSSGFPFVFLFCLHFNSRLFLLPFLFLFPSSFLLLKLNPYFSCNDFAFKTYSHT